MFWCNKKHTLCDCVNGVTRKVKDRVTGSGVTARCEVAGRVGLRQGGWEAGRSEAGWVLGGMMGGDKVDVVQSGW